MRGRHLACVWLWQSFQNILECSLTQKAHSPGHLGLGGELPEAPRTHFSVGLEVELVIAGQVSPEPHTHTTALFVRASKFLARVWFSPPGQVEPVRAGDAPLSQGRHSAILRSAAPVLLGS